MVDIAEVEKSFEEMTCNRNDDRDEFVKNKFRHIELKQQKLLSKTSRLFCQKIELYLVSFGIKFKKTSCSVAIFPKIQKKGLSWHDFSQGLR